MIKQRAVLIVWMLLITIVVLPASALPTPHTPQLRHFIKTPHPILSISFSPDGKTLICGGEWVLRLFDVKTGSMLRSWEVKDADHFNDYGTIEAVAFSPDGKLVAGANDKGAIRVFDLQTGEEEPAIRVKPEIPDSYRILSIKFSPNSKLIASVSGAYDSVDSPIYGEIKLWDVTTKSLLFDLPPEADFIWSVAFSPDGRRLATANQKQTVKIWDLETRSLERTLTGFGGVAYSAVFTPDSRKLVTGGEDKTIRVWSTANWRLEREIKGHKDRVLSVAISSQGWLVSGGAGDQTIRRWDIATGKTSSLLRSSEYVNTVTISSDGKWLACGTADGRLMIWEDR